ncbi:MAG: NAD(P)/FAD-dependent oxidoreductase [Promethearchaeota archaeon]
MNVNYMEFDVLIVGAGPAGVSAAFFLSYFDRKKRLKIGLLEKRTSEIYEKYHRKCGEGVSPKLFKELCPIKPKFILNTIEKIKEYWGNEKVSEYKEKIYIINRHKFFKELIQKFQKSGGTVIHGTFSSSKKIKDKLLVRLASGKQILTNTLVGADGANSIVRRVFNFGSVYQVPVRQYITDFKYSDENNVAFLFFNEKYDGNYKYIFPSGDKWKVGSNRLDVIDKNIIQTQSRMIAFGGLDQYVKDNVILIGDAAGQTNPITKGGIRPGMIGGKILAKCIIKGRVSEFNSIWKKSPYSSRSFINGYHKFRKMNNKELIEFSKPLNASIIKALILLLKNRKYWDLYRTFIKCDKYGY